MNMLSREEAKIAWAQGKKVEINLIDDKSWIEVSSGMVLHIFDVEANKFRIKPEVFPLNAVAIPAQFNPKQGDEAWFISDDHGCGYASTTCNRFTEFKYGAWDSEEKVKQVVEAVSKLLKGPHQ